MQGFLLINKPSGMTSFAVCAALRRITGERRIGHTGTLDPMATGVLPVFIGRPTSLCDYLLCADKRYTARVKLGIATDTDDITGNIIKESKPVTDIKVIKQTLESFVGTQQQFPPIYSAIKKDGVALYKLARKGQEVEVAAREITVHSITLLSDVNEHAEFDIDVVCSKGTYIRSLCRDIGEKLGCYATLSKLERTKTGSFTLDECVSLDILNSENINDYILPAECSLPHLRSITVTEKQAVRFSNGGELDIERIKSDFYEDGEIIKVFCNNVFLGLGKADLNTKQLCVKCVLTQYKM